MGLLFANGVVLLLAPRALGPASFGVYEFLINIFKQIFSIADLGFSTAFYVKLSRNNNNVGVLKFIIYYTIIICSSIFLFVFILIKFDYTLTTFNSHPDKYIYYALLFSGFTWLILLLRYTSDAFGLTIRSELVIVILKLIGAAVIGLLFIKNKLVLASLFEVNIIVLLFISLVIILTIRTHYQNNIKHQKVNTRLRSVLSEFWVFSHPLIFVSILSAMVIFLERWLLQIFYGDVEQGNFGVSFRLIAICTLFGSAMVQLITREFSISHNNLAHRKTLFEKHVPFFVLITSIMAMFIAPNSSGLIKIVGGNQFESAKIILLILSIYPVHQIIGQLTASYFLANDLTKTYRNIIIISGLINIAITWFFLAPGKYYGLHLGGSGLALKMVFIQFITVNISLYIITKLLQICYYKYLWYQIASITLFYSLAKLTTTVVSTIVTNNILMSTFVAGLLYMILSLSLLLVSPGIFGVRRDYLYRLLRFWK